MSMTKPLFLVFSVLGFFSIFLSSPMSVGAALGTACNTSIDCGGYGCDGGDPSTAIREGFCKGPCSTTDQCVAQLPSFGWDNAVCTGNATKPGSCIEAPVDEIPRGPQNPDELIAVTKVVTNWIFMGFSALAVIFIILAGWQFIAHGGEPQAVSQARSKLMYAAIGIAIALISQGIVPVIKAIVGG